MRRSQVVCLAVLALALSVVTSGTAVGSVSGADKARSQHELTSPPAANADVAEVDWRQCDDEPGYDCATIQVPLDYDQPYGEQIDLGLLRDPADDPSRRIGSLFVNPGGPGASAVQFAADAGRELGTKVRQRFDIVGVDPRGVGRSTAVTCTGKYRDHPVHPPVAFPFGDEEETGWLRADASDRTFCANHHNAVFDHASTADNARDLDLVRDALGEERLTYYGISYGTYLGQTYAAMFPDRIRAIVLDGVLDPIAWSKGHGRSGHRLGFSTRLRSGRGAYEALTSALVECDRVGAERCSAAGDAYGKWRTVVRKARNGKLAVDGQPISYSSVVSYLLGGLYERGLYEQLAQYVQYLYVQSTSRTGSRAYQRSQAAALRITGRLRDLFNDRLRRGLYAADAYDEPETRTVADPFAAVACSDSANPDDPRAWIHAGRRDDRIMPWFGRLWTWRSSICASWPGSPSDSFRGPWRTQTSSPVLVVANAHDPSTPIGGARVANQLFDGSRLLMLDGWGHGAYGESTCVTEYTERYLVTQRLPESGTVCKPDLPLYP
ncbi:alpha/beta hydrolase [Solicola gregarius]|uniref:Alpha/beta hydrolase n=1 Tax=Solicola gregarius TaxID=2908642 RepID=A0AA46YL73_9ACTN|nr:alpha/beta hydrolase [Solicola gregarius]UYM06282.1 alpha/beta hydrolase [Solicola gregarius]